MSIRYASDEVPQPDAQVLPAAQALPSGPALTPCSSAVPPGPGLAACDHTAPFQCTISARPEVVEPAAQALPSGPALTPISCPGMGLKGSRWLLLAGGFTVAPGGGAPQAERPAGPLSSAAVPAMANTARRRRDPPARGAAANSGHSPLIGPRLPASRHAIPGTAPAALCDGHASCQPEHPSIK